MKAKVVSLRKNNFHIYTVCTVVLITTVLAFFVSVEIAAWTNLMKYAGTELTLYRERCSTAASVSVKNLISNMITWRFSTS